MTFKPAQLHKILAQFPKAKRYVVAFSGGLDSTVLLHAMATCRGEMNIDLRAVHINHGLQAQSQHWQRHCQEICHTLEVPLDCLSVTVEQHSGKGLEAAARAARYAAFESSMQTGDVLCLAHHQDDQAETLLLQLLRGAGVAGLASMPMVKVFPPGYLLRPLLQYRRDQLRDYAQQYQLNWIEDPSNEQIDFDRNYLRHEVMPAIKHRWPASDVTLARSATHLAEANALLKEVAAQDWRTVADGMLDRLSIESLQPLSIARQRNLLRYWVHTVNRAPLPDSQRLQQIFDEVIEAAEDGQPCVQWHGVAVRRYRQYLYLTPGEMSQPGGQPWDLYGALSLPELDIRLVPLADAPAGLNAELVGRPDMRIAYRRGGEVCRPSGRGGQHHDLKKLMQEWGVPPWQRSRVPLLFVGDEIAAVIGHCICEGFASDPGTRGIGIKIEDLSGDGIATMAENNDNSQD